MSEELKDFIKKAIDEVKPEQDEFETTQIRVFKRVKNIIVEIQKRASTLLKKKPGIAETVLLIIDALNITGDSELDKMIKGQRVASNLRASTKSLRDIRYWLFDMKERIRTEIPGSLLNEWYLAISDNQKEIARLYKNKNKDLFSREEIEVLNELLDDWFRNDKITEAKLKMMKDKLVAYTYYYDVWDKIQDTRIEKELSHTRIEEEKKENEV